MFLRRRCKRVLVRPIAGERAIVPFQISCGRCDRCLAGTTANCEAYPKLLPEVLSHVAAGRLRRGVVTTRVVDWEAPRAFTEPSIKLVVTRASR
jgi:hypothetical protein